MVTNWECGNSEQASLHFYVVLLPTLLNLFLEFLRRGEEGRGLFLILNDLVIRHNNLKQHITALSCPFVIVTKIQVESDEMQLVTFCKLVWYLAKQVIRRRFTAWTNARLSNQLFLRGQWQELTEALVCYYSLVCRHDGVWVRLISSGLAQILVLFINLPKQHYLIQYFSRPSFRRRVYFTTVLHCDIQVIWTGETAISYQNNIFFP